MVSNQQEKILEILPSNKSSTGLEYDQIKQAYYNIYGEEIGNVYTQKNRLVDANLVTRIDDGYKRSVQGNNLVEKGRVIKEDVFYTREEIEEFEEFSNQKDFYELLSTRAFPDILGQAEAKLACLLSTVSPEDTTNKNRVSVLLNGEKGTGKSHLMKMAVKYSDGIKTEYGSSEAGLRGNAQGERTPGALEKADKSVLGIDELDKFKSGEQKALYSALNNGHITITKGNLAGKEVDTRIRAIATSNNLSKIQGPLVDRFDLVVEMYELTSDEKRKLLQRKFNDWDREKDVDLDSIQKYLNYVKKFEVNLPNNRNKLVNQVFEHFDSLSDISNRRIEGIIRISKSLARLKLDEEVDKEHVKKACELIDKHGR